MPPFKVTIDIAEIRWSKWVESMRKDVECTFGILKGCWRILKTGIRVEDIEAVDKIWLTCCALHNWLLDIDVLDEEWTDGVPTSTWTGAAGELNFDGIQQHIPEDLPNAVSRLATNLEPRNYDVSGMGRGADVDEPHPIELDIGVGVGKLSADALDGNVRLVKNLPLGFFRRKLV